MLPYRRLSRFHPIFAAAIVHLPLPVLGQVAATVSVNASSPIKYANNSTIATMPATGLGLHTSVYANQWGNSTLPGLIAASGVQTLRYPGGSYSDEYNWSLGTTNDGGYVANNSGFGNFISVMDQSSTSAVVTVNYGSNTTNTMGGQPQEGAAWVAYADSSASISGTSSDVTLGNDAAGVNWYTAGYWAKLRASTPAAYKTWATAAGDYNPAYAFLAVNHPAAENVNYWEIGNEIGGNGYYGTQYEYDLHAPYLDGNTSSNSGRLGNPALSPTAYADNLIQFATLMKEVDPNIKIGADFSGKTNNAGDQTILQTAGGSIDFGIIHWYPTTPIAGAVSSGSGSLPSEVGALRTQVQADTNKGYNGIEIDMTEFGYNASGATRVDNALFAADAYITGFENGVKNMDFLEMSKSSYLGDSNPLVPGEVYYTLQMLSRFARTGSTFESETSSDSLLKVHAAQGADGNMSLLFINYGVSSDHSADRTISITLTGTQKLSTTGTFYVFGDAQITATAVAVPVETIMTNLGSTITLTIPEQSIGELIIPAAPEPDISAAFLLGAAAVLGRRLRCVSGQSE